MKPLPQFFISALLSAIVATAVTFVWLPEESPTVEAEVDVGTYALESTEPEWESSLTIDGKEGTVVIVEQDDVVALHVFTEGRWETSVYAPEPE